MPMCRIHEMTRDSMDEIADSYGGIARSTITEAMLHVWLKSTKQQRDQAVKDAARKIRLTRERNSRKPTG